MQNASLYERLIKRVYGINGVLDEYKQQTINRIGNNAFLIFIGYFIFTTLMAIGCSFFYPTDQILAVLLWANILAAMCISNYVATAIDRLKINEADSPAKNKVFLQQRLRHRAIRSALFFGMMGWLIDVSFDLIFDQQSFSVAIHSLSSIKSAVLSGIAFGLMFFFFSSMLAKLKD